MFLGRSHIGTLGAKMLIKTAQWRLLQVVPYLPYSRHATVLREGVLLYTLKPALNDKSIQQITVYKEQPQHSHDYIMLTCI